MTEVYICDAIRTPVGRYGGSLAAIRTDDLAAIPLKALMDRNPDMDWAAIDDIYMGCANQAGEDNRNVARMSSLLAGYDESVPGATVNRLCGSGMDAIGMAARAIKAGEVDVMIAGGVETTRTATSHGMRLLIEHPDELQKLVDDPSLIPGAVEEILRFYPSFIYMLRTATEDVTLGDMDIKQGDLVRMFYPSVNHDPEIFGEDAADLS